MRKNILFTLSAVLVMSSLQSTAQETEALQIKNKTLSVLILIKSDDKTVEIDNRLENKLNLDDVDPNQVRTISVLKGNDAVEQYGEKARDGVIVINLLDYASLSSKSKKLFEKAEKKD